MGLEEALGVPELVAALSELHVVVEYIRETPKSRIELETTVKRLENEKTQIHREYLQAEAQHDGRLQKMRAELQNMQMEITELKRLEPSANHLSSQVAALEKVIAEERFEKDKYASACSKLKVENANLRKEFSSLQQESVISGRGENSPSYLVSLCLLVMKYLIRYFNFFLAIIVW